MPDPEDKETQVDDLPIANTDGENGGGGEGNDTNRQPADDKGKPNDELLEEMRKLREVTERGQQSKGDDGKKQLSPEEEEELWAVFNPDKVSKTFIKDFFNLPDDASNELIEKKREQFNIVQKGFVKQAVVTARNLHTMDFEKFRGEFKPIQEYVTKAEQREAQRAFVEKFPGLGDKKFEKIIRLCEKDLQRDKFKSEEDYQQALAESAAKTIEEATGQKIELGAKPPEKPTGTSPRVPRTSVGGTGGTGGGSSSGKERADGVNSLL